MVGSYLAPKEPTLVLFCRMDHQKSNFSLIFGILSVRGCWGQPILLFWKLFDETQMSKNQDVKTNFKQNTTCIFLSVRHELLLSVHIETPCRTHFFYISKSYIEFELHYSSSPRDSRGLKKAKMHENFEFVWLIQPDLNKVKKECKICKKHMYFLKIWLNDSTSILSFSRI